jgi:hypothetical protein
MALAEEALAPHRPIVENHPRLIEQFFGAGYWAPRAPE